MTNKTTSILPLSIFNTLIVQCNTETRALSSH